MLKSLIQCFWQKNKFYLSGRIKIVTSSKVVFCYIFFGKLSLFRYSKVIKKKIITIILPVYFEIKNI